MTPFPRDEASRHSRASLLLAALLPALCLAALAWLIYHWASAPALHRSVPPQNSLPAPAVPASAPRFTTRSGAHGGVID